MSYRTVATLFACENICVTEDHQALQRAANEAARLATLHRYNILDTLPEQAYDDIVQLASYVAGTPISLVTLVDAERQWFKAATGLGARQTPRLGGFCTHAVETAATLLIEDAQADERFKDHPFVVGEPRIRFYAGAPIVAPGGQVLGTLCVIDDVPRTLTLQQIAALEALARQVTELLEQRRLNAVQMELSELLRLEAHEQGQLEAVAKEQHDLHSFLLKLADRQRYFREPRQLMELAAESVGSQLKVARVGFAEVSADQQHVSFETGWTAGTLDLLHGSMPIADFGEGNAADLKQGRTLIYPDVRDDPRAIASQYESIGARSVIAVPLMRGGAWRGSFYVNDTNVRNWTEAEIELVQQVAERTVELLERAQTEEMLRRREGQLNLALEAADLATWFYDPERQIVGGDQKMARFFGLTIPEGPAALWLEPIVEEDRPRVGEEFAAAVQGAPYDTEYRLKKADGSIRWIRAKAQLVTDTITARLVGICEDVTRRKLIEESLRSTAERLIIAQKTGRMASWQWDLTTGHLTWDEGTIWTYGRSPSEMSSIDNIFSFIHEDDRARIAEDIQPALAGLGEFELDFRVIWPDGSTHWNQAFGKPLTVSGEGKPTSIIGINIDVTERKLSEAALLQNEKLSAVGRLASSIAHEINNPLEAVTNLLYLAQHSETIEEAGPYLRSADVELRRVGNIASQTLRFHKQATRPTAVTFAELTNGIFTGLHGRLTNAHVTTEVRDQSKRSVLCFEGEIRQVLANLISNAIYAMQARGGTLFLRCRGGHDWETDTAGLVITVADTGTGMSEAVQARIFDAFFTTKGIGGTGLGLWISGDIINRHHGKLRVKSSTRERLSGTVFTVFLPFDATVRTASLPQVDVTT